MKQIASNLNEDNFDKMSVLRLELMDELIACKKDMENNLREGFFLLGKARYILGVNSVSMLQTPSTECDISSVYNSFASVESFEEFPSTTISRYEIHSNNSCQTKRSEGKDSALRKRGNNKEVDEDDGCIEEIEKKKPDPLSWFSGLPPQSLRSAQSQFTLALTKSAECATIQKSSDTEPSKDEDNEGDSAVLNEENVEEMPEVMNLEEEEIGLEENYSQILKEGDSQNQSEDDSHIQKECDSAIQKKNDSEIEEDIPLIAQEKCSVTEKNSEIVSEVGIVASDDSVTEQEDSITNQKDDSLIQIEESSVEFIEKIAEKQDNIDDYSLDVPEEECRIEAEDIAIKEIYDKESDMDMECSAEDPLPQTSSDDPPKTAAIPSVAAKEVSTLRMQMSKEDIERMIIEGKLEKVSDGYYKVKAGSLQGLKISGKSASIEKPTQSEKPSSDATKAPILNSVLTRKTATISAKSVSNENSAPKRAGSKVGSATKKLKTFKESKVGKLDTPPQVAKIVTTPMTFPRNVQAPLTTVVSAAATIQTPPSYIALMPVNQVSNNSNNAIITLPVQQNIVTNYNPSLPTYITIPHGSVPSTLAAPPQIITEVIKAPTVPPVVPSVIPNAPVKNIPQTKPSKPLVIPEKLVKPSIIESSTLPTQPMRASIQKPKPIEGATTATISTPVSSSTISGGKRRPQFETTKVKRPYKFAKPLRKRRRSRKLKDFVSDLNSSEEEEEENSSEKSKSHGIELAAMFFKKIGEPTKPDRSLLDKLHKAIFCDANLNSEEEEEDSDESDVGDVVSDIKTGRAKYQAINCPGPGQYEAFVGPANNSKLSIIRCKETKQIKNFMYEVYKVRVTSFGREANTNILIPVPDGYKFQLPSKPKEELVEFSHVPHEDPESTNYVSPVFLEKLADTELKLRKYKEEIKVLRSRYLELLQEYANRPQFSTLSDLVGASAKFLTEDQLVFFLMQLKAGAHNMQGIRYSVREKVLALSIYQKSPEVYKWLHKVFHLPSKRILDQWLEDVGVQDPQLLKKLMYHIYTTYNFKADV